MPFLQIYGVGGNLSDEAFRKVEGKGDGGGEEGASRRGWGKRSQAAVALMPGDQVCHVIELVKVSAMFIY